MTVLGPPPPTPAKAQGGGHCRTAHPAESIVPDAGPHVIITACKQRPNIQWYTVIMRYIVIIRYTAIMRYTVILQSTVIMQNTELMRYTVIRR